MFFKVLIKNVAVKMTAIEFKMTAIGLKLYFKPITL